MTTAHPAAPQLEAAGSARRLAGIGAAVIVFGAGLGVVRFVGGSPMERGMQGALASVAMAALVAVPGLLTLMARAGRPALLVPAGAALVPLAFVSFGGIALPLLVPAVMLLVASCRRSAVGYRPRVPMPVSSAVILAMVIGAAAALIVHADPRTFVTPTVSGSTSDVVTYAESALSLALVGAALGFGRWSSSSVSG